jgi:hypothetical protein
MPPRSPAGEDVRDEAALYNRWVPRTRFSDDDLDR